MKYNIRDARKLIGAIAKGTNTEPFASLNLTDVTTGANGWNASRIWPIIKQMAKGYSFGDNPTTDYTVDQLTSWVDGGLDIGEQLARHTSTDDWVALFNYSRKMSYVEVTTHIEAAKKAVRAEQAEVAVAAEKPAPWEEPAITPSSTSKMGDRLSSLRARQKALDEEIDKEASAIDEVVTIRKEIKELAMGMGKAVKQIKLDAIEATKKIEASSKEIAKSATVDASAMKGIVGEAVQNLYASATEEEKKVLKSAAKAASELPKIYSKDSTFVPPVWFDRLKIWISAGIHVAIGGSTGAGKTFPAKQACAALGLPAKTIAMNGGIDAETLVAIPHLKGGTSTYVDGFLTHAMRHGYVLILDEADSLRQEEALVLNDAIESRMITVPFTGEVVEAADGFAVIFTSNSLGDELGLYNREGFDASLLNRCRMVLAKPLSVEQEVKILTSLKCPNGHAISREDASKLAQWAKVARTAHFGSKGQDPVLRTNPSTRVLVNTVADWLGYNPDTRKSMPAFRDDDLYKSDIRKALQYTFASCLNDDERVALKALDLWVWA